MKESGIIRNGVGKAQRKGLEDEGAADRDIETKGGPVPDERQDQQNANDGAYVSRFVAVDPGYDAYDQHEKRKGTVDKNLPN